MASKILRRICLITIIIAALAAFFGCTKTTPARPEEEEKPCEHVFGKITAETEPTEKSVGEGKAVCSLCGEESVFYIPILSEDNYDLTEKAATCTEDGERVYKSEKYGEYKTAIKAEGHSDVFTEIPPTCSEEGKRIFECKKCGRKTEETIERTAHNYKLKSRENADCTHYGKNVYECTVCGDVYSVDGTEYLHDYDDGVYVPAVCPDLGYTEFTCKICSATKKVYDEFPEHAYDEKTGKCTVCNQVCRHAFDGYVCSVCHLDIEKRVEEDGFFLVDEDGDGKASVGEYVYYGFYPRSVVSDEETIKKLVASGLGADGYYTVDGKKYVEKQLNQRYAALAYFSDGTPMKSSVFSDGYYFRSEPIKWTVVAVEEGRAKLRATECVDVTEYLAKTKYKFDENAGNYVNNEDKTHYACDWETSDLRRYLNETFFNAAFNDKQKALLEERVSDNGKNNAYYKDKVYAVGGDTSDKVFVDAYGEVYGEGSVEGGAIVKATDYALSSGIDLSTDRSGYVGYYTRTAGEKADKVGVIDKNGQFSVGGGLYFETDENGNTKGGIGVVPCLWIKF